MILMAEASIFDLLNRLALSPPHDDLWLFFSQISGELRLRVRHHSRMWGFINEDELFEAVTDELLTDECVKELRTTWADEKKVRLESTDERSQLASDFLHSFLKRIVSRVGKRLYREAIRQHPLTLEDSVAALTPQVWPVESVTSTKVRNALETLSSEDQHLLLERFVEEKPIKIIAKEREISYSSAATRVFRAKERLRMLLEVDN